MPLYDVRPRLGELRMPALILAGRHDRVCSLNQARIMEQGISGSRLVIFEKSGHMPQMEETDRYNQTVSDFLA